MVSIPPDDALIQALLRTGYKWYEAVLDIIDNCIDAIKDTLEEDDTFEGRIFVHAEQDYNWRHRLWHPRRRTSSYSVPWQIAQTSNCQTSP